MNKSNRNRFMDTENILRVARWKEDLGRGEKGEGIKKHKLVVAL